VAGAEVHLDLAAEFIARQARDEHIDDHQVRQSGVHGGERGLAVADDLDRVAGFFEAELRAQGLRGRIFNQQEGESSTSRMYLLLGFMSAR
jgi:hypothetical protein